MFRDPLHGLNGAKRLNGLNVLNEHQSVHACASAQLAPLCTSTAKPQRRSAA